MNNKLTTKFNRKPINYTFSDHSIDILKNACYCILTIE